MMSKLGEWLWAGFWFILIVGGLIWLYWPKDSADDTSYESTGYSNCTEAHNDGVYDIQEGDPAYVSSQDADGDGIACEHYLGN